MACGSLFIPGHNPLLSEGEQTKHLAVTERNCQARPTFHALISTAAKNHYEQARPRSYHPHRFRVPALPALPASLPSCYHPTSPHVPAQRKSTPGFEGVTTLTFRGQLKESQTMFREATETAAM